jgi:hypothetical protein
MTIDYCAYKSKYKLQSVPDFNYFDQLSKNTRSDLFHSITTTKTTNKCNL